MYGKNDSKKFDTMCGNFNRTINQLLRIVVLKMPRDNADMWILSNRVKLCISVSQDELISRCWDKIYENKQCIIDKDEMYLLNNDIEEKMVAKYIKKDESEDIMKTMIKNIKKLWPLSSPEEKNAVWEKLQFLLNVTAEYMLYKGFFAKKISES